MLAWPFKRDQYRQLHLGERRLLYDHLQRLSEATQFDRFLAYVDSSDLMAHVNRDEPEHETIGWFNRGVMRGAIEIFFGATGAEASLAIERRWRGQGVGTELIGRALSRAHEKGMTSLTVPGHDGNYPLLAIATRFGAVQTAFRNHMVRGLLPIEHPRALAYHFDVQEVAHAQPFGLFRKAFTPLRV